MGYKKTLTPGAIEIEQGTLSATREDVRLNQLVPSEILENIFFVGVFKVKFK